MCNRRNKPICQAAVLLALIGGLGYTFYLYNMTTMDLEIARSEADKYLKQQGSLSSQLQVVYEHRARLERSLQKEKTEHKNTKLDFSKKQNDFLLNVTRSKHEAMNRFNSLETQYNMLKAQAKELDTDYNRLRQQYARLSSEHTTLNNQQKRNFQLYKEQKANEIASLDEEINTLKRQVVSLRTQVKTKAEEAEQYQLSSSRAMSANQKYQEMLKTLQEELASYKEKLKNAVRQPRTDESARDEKHDLDRREARKKDGNFLVDSNKERIIEKEKVERRQEKESPATPSRSDSRQHQDRYRRQTLVQVTLPSDNDADQADMRRPPDGNVNERKQDVSDESQTRGEILSRSSDRSKPNENAQDDGYSRRENIPLRNSDQDIRVADKGKSDLYPGRDNIPLRDSNQDTRLADKEPGVKVVSPTENAMNKWADILKAARQGHKDEGEDREEANKEINEESREERKTLDGDDKQHGGNKQSDLYQRQRGEEEIKEEHIGKPVADRPDVHGDQAQEQREHRNQDNQGIGFNDRGDEEGHKDDEADGLSRQNINKKMAEMEETYQEKQINQQQQGGQLQGQENARRPAGYNQVAPISAVQRQETVQQQRAQPAADADNDDEDAADDDQNDQDEDPDEEDPDDAGEEDGDNLEDSPQQQQQQQQQQQVHQAQQQDANKHDRSLKAADNNKQNEQETKLT